MEFCAEVEKKIKTKEDLIFYLKEIDLASELILKNGEKTVFEKLENKISRDLLDILLKLEKEKKEEFQDSKQQALFFELLKNHLLSLPQVKIEIAFSPDDLTILKISRWFEKELGKKVVLELKVNTRVIGGAIVEYKGKLIDFSLVKEIKKMKINNLEELINGH